MSSRLGLLMDPRNPRAVEIEEVRAWRVRVNHSTSGEFWYYRFYLEQPLSDSYRKKGDAHLLKFTEPDGTVWYAEKVDTMTRDEDEEDLREKALKKLSGAERAVLGWPKEEK